jgi:hypothetical protein
MTSETNKQFGKGKIYQKRLVTILSYSIIDSTGEHGNEWSSVRLVFTYEGKKTGREIVHIKPTWSTTGRLLVDKGPLEPGSRYLVTIEKENEYQVWTDIQLIEGVA